LKKRGEKAGGTPMYWGKLPSTSGPPYLGVTLWFFLFFGLIVIKKPLKWWVISGLLLTLVLSLGKNAGFFNEFFFNYIPFYNKFRTANSMIGVTSCILPILGLLAIQKLLDSENKKEFIKPLLVSGGLIGSICLFFGIAGPFIFDFVGLKDGDYESMGILDFIRQDRQALMRFDGLRSLLLCLMSMGTLYVFIKDKISKNILLSVLSVLILFDVFAVSLRYVNHQSFKAKKSVNAALVPRAADNKILQDPDIHYRVHDKSINSFNSAQASYFHKTIGGYHAAKLSRIQNIITRHLNKNNRKILDMFNVKYIIEPDKIAYLNQNAAGNAWFVNEVKYVQDAETEISALANINVKNEAFVHQEFVDQLTGLQIVKNGKIELRSYEPNRLIYDYTAVGEQLAVFSEVWYGPDKGWYAFIDGKYVDHIRANYILRALRVPGGKHTIEFVFDSPKFRTGSTIALVSSILFGLITLALMGLLGRKYLAKRKSFMPSTSEAPEKVSKPKKIKSAKKKKGATSIKPVKKKNRKKK